ncbi:WD40-repeat-containing domain protein [Xylaria palmicola]|nr:WD40-repeat-containing domain protein [Xylaria palmicola]
MVTSASDDRTVRLWDALPSEDQDGNNGQSKPPYRGHSDYVYCLAFSPDGRYLASAGHESQIRVQQEDFRTELGPSPASRSLAFFPDGDRIVSASTDGQLRVWDRRKSRQCLHTIKAKNRDVPFNAVLWNSN